MRRIPSKSINLVVAGQIYKAGRHFDIRNWPRFYQTHTSTVPLKTPVVLQVFFVDSNGRKTREDYTLTSDGTYQIPVSNRQIDGLTIEVGSLPATPVLRGASYTMPPTKIEINTPVLIK